MYLSLTSPSVNGSINLSVSLFYLEYVYACDLSCLQAKLVEDFVKGILPAQRGKHRGNDVRLLKNCYKIFYSKLMNQ